MKFVKYCNRIIEYSFYSLFLLVPLVFSGSTSELFELNKMWLTFGVTAIVAAAWGSKMALEKKIHIQRTPFDIPLLLFFASQFISTLITLDPAVSWWGYYSRFNGGFFSTICYVLLYYAFVSNLSVKHVIRSLAVTLIAGFLTALWGFPAHFGYDPTCLVFRGTFDTSCWTEAFKPTVRTFSTLGQPAWFAAYLAFLIPLAMAYTLKIHRSQKTMWMFLGLAIFFYINLQFANTRAGLYAFWAANIIFWAAVYFKKLLERKYFLRAFAIFNIGFLLVNFIFGGPLGPLYKYTLPAMTQNASAPVEPTLSGNVAPPETTAQPAQAAAPATANITDSGNIRLNVWNGAIAAWQSSPVFGTGVETFAFAYYKHKPVGHNLTSEWDYLYNKAHNEFLNYLTTTGLFGLGTYLAFIGIFMFFTAKWLWRHTKEHAHVVEHNDIISDHSRSLIITGLLAGFVSILITNFFGFSVVIMNLLLFLVPVFVLILAGKLPHKSWGYTFGEAQKVVTGPQWTVITILAIAAVWINIGLLVYRQADVSYALGMNLNKTGNYQEAYTQLTSAVQTMPSEAVYKDELSINLAAIAAALYTQKVNDQAGEAAKNAISLSNEVVEKHPNNVVYWKNRVRLFYTLAATDPANAPQYYQEAIKSIDRAKELAPTDAKIAYNQGILYGQVGQIDKAVAMLSETVKMKPDYADVYVALGLFYRQQALDKDGKVVNAERNQKAIETYEFILEKLSPGNKEVQTSLDEWKK